MRKREEVKTGKKLCQEQLSCTEITAEKVQVIRYHIVVGVVVGDGAGNIYKILQHFCYFQLISDISVANKSRHPYIHISFGAHFIVDYCCNTFCLSLQKKSKCRFERFQDALCLK